MRGVNNKGTGPISEGKSCSSTILANEIMHVVWYFTVDASYMVSLSPVRPEAFERPDTDFWPEMT